MTYIETTAVVVGARQEEHSEIYYPIYEFEVDGKKVQAEGLPAYSDEIEIGSEQTINYNPKNYKQFDEGSKSGGLLLFIFGIVILTSTIPPLKYFIKCLKRN